MFCQKLSQAAMPQFKAFPRLELDCVITFMDAGIAETLNILSWGRFPEK
jgi:hypothetical protein